MEFNALLDELIPQVTLEENKQGPKRLLSLAGAKIKAYRKRKGVSQVALSRASGISQANISKLENGDYNISLAQLEKLALALDAHIELEVKRNEPLYPKTDD